MRSSPQFMTYLGVPGTSQISRDQTLSLTYRLTLPSSKGTRSLHSSLPVNLDLIDILYQCAQFVD